MRTFEDIMRSEFKPSAMILQTPNYEYDRMERIAKAYAKEALEELTSQNANEFVHIDSIQNLINDLK